MSYYLHIETPKCSCCGLEESYTNWSILGNFCGIISATGLSEVLGRGAKITTKKAIPLLEAAKADVLADFPRYEKMQARFGDWGSADHFVHLLVWMIEYCKANPTGVIYTEK